MRIIFLFTIILFFAALYFNISWAQIKSYLTSLMVCDNFSLLLVCFTVAIFMYFVLFVEWSTIKNGVCWFYNFLTYKIKLIYYKALD